MTAAITIYRPALVMLTQITNRKIGSRMIPATIVIGSPMIGTHDNSNEYLP